MTTLMLRVLEHVMLHSLGQFGFQVAPAQEIVLEFFVTDYFE